MRLISGLPIWLKMTVISAVTMAAAVSAILYYTTASLSPDVAHAAHEVNATGLRVASTLLIERMDGVKVVDHDGGVAAIVVDTWSDFAADTGANHSFVDAVAQMTGGTASIFGFDPNQSGFVDRTTTVRNAEEERALGSYLGEAHLAYAAIMDAETHSATEVILGISYETVYVPILSDNSQVPTSASGVAGILRVGIPTAALQAGGAKNKIALFAISAFCVLVAAAITGLLSFRMLKPLGKSARQMRAIADGERVNVTITHHDEFGVMQEALARLAKVAQAAFRHGQVVRQSTQPIVTAQAWDSSPIDFANDAAKDLIFAVREEGARLAEPEEGTPLSALHPRPDVLAAALADPDNLPFRDRTKTGGETLVYAVEALWDRDGNHTGAMLTLTSTTDEERTADQFETDVASLLGNVNSAVLTLNNRIARLENSARSGLADAAEVTRVANDSSTAIQTVVAAIEELTGSFAEVSQRIGENSRIAEEAAKATANASATAKGLEEASKRISEVVGLIADVAAQTKLLALNATIEASHAGEAGRGFAVVAGEVKGLAQRAANATDEISKEVERVTTAGDALLSAVHNVQTAISKVGEVSTAVAGAVEEQQTTASEITETVVRVAEGAKQVCSLAESVTTSSGRTGAAVDEVSSLAAELDSTGRELKSRADRFLEKVRHAA
ncbi:MAG: methyl-accepting chemotaxis protein [Pseudomonadota bacterium]